jgi:hypothetical protein
MPGLYPNSFPIAYVVKKYMLLMSIRTSYENPDSPLGAFRKEYLLLGFSFILPYLTFVTHTIHHNATLIHTLVLDPFSYLQIQIYYILIFMFLNLK